MATFEVREIFRLPARQAVVITGRVMEGSVAQGMEVKFELQTGLFCGAVIKGVEFIDQATAGDSLVALVLAEQDERDAIIYSDLSPAGSLIEVAEIA